MIDQSIIATACLFAGWYCLYRALTAWLVRWFHKKTQDGARKVIIKIKQIKQRVEDCINSDQLIELALSTETHIIVPIVVRGGNDDDPVEVDYQYGYNIDNKVKTLTTLVDQRNAEMISTKFEQIKTQLIDELEEAIADVEQRLIDQ